jgi:hypothetical protein
VRIWKNTSGGIASLFCGSFRQFISFTILLPWQMLNSKASKMPFHLSYLSKTLDQLWLFGLILLFNVLLDDFSIVLYQEIARSQGSHFS